MTPQHPKSKQPELTHSQEDKLFSAFSYWESHLENKAKADDLRNLLIMVEEESERFKQSAIKVIVDAVNHPVEPIALRRIAREMSRAFPNTALSYSTLYYHVNK